jgi:hypothetical protein
MEYRYVGSKYMHFMTTNSRLGDTALPRSVAWMMKEWQSRKWQHRK